MPLPAPQDEFRHFAQQVCITGRLVPLKGHRYAIEAVHLLKDRFPGLGLVIVGTGPAEQELKSQVQALGLGAQVAFAGFSTQVLSYMQASDVVAIPSEGEGFGLVALEAMAVARPVVAFDVPALNEIVAHGHTGLLAPQVSAQDLSEALARLLSDPALAQRMGLAGQERGAERFSQQRHVEGLASWYAQALPSAAAVSGK